MDNNLSREFIDLDRQSGGLSPLEDFEGLVEEKLMYSELQSSYKEFKEVLSQIPTLKGKTTEFIKEHLEVIRNYKDRTMFFLNVYNDTQLFEYVSIESCISEIQTTLEEIEKNLKDILDEIQQLPYFDLPDMLYFDSDIDLYSINGSKYTLSIDELHLDPEKGQEDNLVIKLIPDEGETLYGNIEIKYGDMNYDEDGNVSDAKEEGIDFIDNCIVEMIKTIANEWQEVLDDKQEIVQTLEDMLSELNHNNLRNSILSNSIRN